MATLKFHTSALVAFVAAAAVAWMLRFTLMPAGDAARSSRPIEFRAPRARDIPVSATSNELLSVKMGLLQWPGSNDPAEIAAAFRNGLSGLQPFMTAEFYGENLHSEQDKVRQLFADWWKYDPAAAIRFVSDPPGSFMSRGGMFLLPFVAERDPRQAWRLADLAQNNVEREVARMEVMRVWAHRAPQEALAFAAELPTAQRGGAERAAAAAWAASHASDAIAWAAALPDGWRRRQLLNAVVRSAAASNPAALATALREGAVEVNSTGISLFVKGDNGPELTNRMARAVIAVDPDPLAWCLWASVPERQQFAAGAWSALLEYQGIESAEQVSALAARVPESARRSFLSALGEAAPQVGLAWALATGAPLDALAIASARIDAESTLQALRGAPQTKEVIAALRSVVSNSLQRAPVTALEALATLPANEFSDSFRHDAIRSSALVDPVRTLHVLGTLENISPESVSAVLAAGARSDPSGTATALARVELPVSDTVAAESFTRGWAAADPAAASVWVRELPPGDLREGAAAGLARSAAESDPAGAFAWGLEITAPDVRQRVLRTVIEAAHKTGTPLDSLLSEPRLSVEERGVLRAHAASLSER